MCDDPPFCCRHARWRGFTIDRSLCFYKRSYSIPCLYSYVHRTFAKQTCFAGGTISTQDEKEPGLNFIFRLVKNYCLLLLGCTWGWLPFMAAAQPYANKLFTTLVTSNLLANHTSGTAFTQSLTISATSTNSTCGNSNGSITAQATGSPPYLYSINGRPTQAAGNFTGLAAGMYSLVVTDANNEMATLSVTVANSPSPVFAVNAQPTLCSNTTGSIQINNIAGSAPFEARLNADPFTRTTLFEKLGLGIYDISVRDSNGCVTTAQVYVNLNDDLKTDGPDSLVLCEGRSAVIPITSNAESFFWSPTEGLSDPLSLSPTVSPVNDAVYTITSRMGICTTRGSVRLVVNKQPVVDAGTDQRIIKGTSTVLRASVNDSSFSIMWSPAINISNARALQPIVTPVQTQVYTIKAFGPGNCTATDSVLVTVYTPIFIPNVFSPNNDGINDTWLITSLAEYPNAQITIYNRYGQVVHTTKATNPWNGTMNGKTLAVGVYYYVIDLGTPAAGKLSGSVTLLR